MKKYFLLLVPILLFNIPLAHASFPINVTSTQVSDWSGWVATWDGTTNNPCDVNTDDCSTSYSVTTFDDDHSVQQSQWTTNGDQNAFFDSTKGAGDYYIFVFSNLSMCGTQTDNPFTDCQNDPNYLGMITIHYDPNL